nr:hypothetical protein Iba_chr02aCG0030 [Ipomoea batatas]
MPIHSSTLTKLSSPVIYGFSLGWANQKVELMYSEAREYNENEVSWNGEESLGLGLFRLTAGCEVDDSAYHAPGTLRSSACSRALSVPPGRLAPRLLHRPSLSAVVCSLGFQLARTAISFNRLQMRWSEDLKNVEK